MRDLPLTDHAESKLRCFLLVPKTPRSHNLYFPLSKPVTDCSISVLKKSTEQGENTGNRCATQHHLNLNITLNASSSVWSSPIYIGSTSSQLFSPKKQCLMSVTVKQWTVIIKKRNYTKKQKMNSPSDSSKNVTAFPLSQLITGRISKT